MVAWVQGISCGDTLDVLGRTQTPQTQCPRWSVDLWFAPVMHPRHQPQPRQPHHQSFGLRHHRDRHERRSHGEAHGQWLWAGSSYNRPRQGIGQAVRAFYRWRGQSEAPRLTGDWIDEFDVLRTHRAYRHVRDCERVCRRHRRQCKIDTVELRNPNIEEGPTCRGRRSAQNGERRHFCP